MEVLEAIKSRRSIRKFKPDAVPDTVIHELLEAARLAPSGSNLQPTRFIVIKSEAVRSQLKQCTPLPFVAQAPVVLACCIDTSVFGDSEMRYKELMEANAFADTPLSDSNAAETFKKERPVMDESAIRAYLNLNAAIAIEHIALMAEDLGLGSCWIMMFDRDRLRSALDLDARYSIVALLPIGYPDQSPPPRPRIDFDSLVLKEI